MRFLAASLFFALLASASANAQPPDFGRLQTHVALWSSVDGSTSDEHSLQSLLRKLEHKQQKSGSTTAFVRYLFDRARQQFLRDYTGYATFSETLASGTYNCLTGTAVCALLLEHFNIPYTIIETNYHIFVIATVGHERILLEATDPDRGFVAGDDKINDRIREYRKSLPAITIQDKSYYQYRANLYNEVSLDELTGLLYFNRAVVAYNNHNLTMAIDNLTKSAERYRSPRTAEFAAILQITVTESILSPSMKQHYLGKIQSMRGDAVFSARNR